MIRIDEVPEQNYDIGKQEPIETTLTEEEQALYYSFDAEVEDAALMRRPGEAFELYVGREVSTNVLAALKREWEVGGWVVAPFEIKDESGRPLRDKEGPPDEKVFRLVFARPHRHQVLSTTVADALETRQQTATEWNPTQELTIERLARGNVKTSTPLLIRMPTRARPVQALEVLGKYRDMAVEHVAIEVIIDEDDATCNETNFLQKLSDLDCKVTIGKHKNKIEACNAGRVDDWAVLVLASDDMVPVVKGYDQKILEAFEKHFPMRDGALNYADGYNSLHNRPGDPVTCTLPVIGRHLYEQYGCYVYYPEYKSIYCDTDMTFLFTSMKRMVFIDEMIIEHKHPAAGKATNDELYQHNSKHDEPDRMLFEMRKAHNFDAPEILLSILICAVPERRQQLERLVDFLRWQMLSFQYPSRVEICVDLGDGKVGEKRQRLLERAVGNYVAFVDDDDWVDVKYVERVFVACMQGQDACSLVGVITENGINPKRFEHSVRNATAYTRDDGVYIRPVNHLNAVRRDLALKAGFVAKNVGEDVLYADKLVTLIQSEASTGDTPLYHYWYRFQSSVQMQGAR